MPGGNNEVREALPLFEDGMNRQDLKDYGAGMKSFKNFFPNPKGLIGTRSGVKRMPNPSRGIFYRIGVKLGFIPETTFINLIIFNGILFAATNYGVFYKDEKDVFHPLKFEDKTDDPRLAQAEEKIEAARSAISQALMAVEAYPERKHPLTGSEVLLREALIRLGGNNG